MIVNDRTSLTINKSTLRKFNKFIEKKGLEGPNADVELNRLMKRYDELQREMSKK